MEFSAPPTANYPTSRIRNWRPPVNLRPYPAAPRNNPWRRLKGILFCPPKQTTNRLHKKGYQARKDGDFLKAKNYYTQSIKANPFHFKSYFNRGFANDKLGLYEEAIDDYTKALDIDHYNAFAYYNRGIALNKKGDYGTAEENFCKAIQIEPKRADFYHNRGFSLRKQNKL
jgi:tetratricopeptide (TPR) repeat protein